MTVEELISWLQAHAEPGMVVRIDAGREFELMRCWSSSLAEGSLDEDPYVMLQARRS
jgi:hypothetical protein